MFAQNKLRIPNTHPRRDLIVRIDDLPNDVAAAFQIHGVAAVLCLLRLHRHGRYTADQIRLHDKL